MTNDCKKKTTARTTGLTGNQFASVEQGRSYVLSVHSPSGAGEIELLAADSDQQSEPDMFSMLYEKIETARQIPFIAISPFVFVNVGSSDVQWLVTPANFSLAVPGVSSGGGSIIIIAMYLTTLELVAESAFETNVLKIPASAPSGIYELEFPGGIASYTFNVFAFENYDSLASSNQSLLELANPPLIVTNGTATVLEWMWDDVESASMVSIPNGSTIASLKCFFSHTQGTETNLLKLMGVNIFTSGISVKKVVVRQIA